MGWFLYDNSLRLERVNIRREIGDIPVPLISESCIETKIKLNFSLRPGLRREC